MKYITRLLNFKIAYFFAGAFLGIALCLKFEWGQRTILNSLSPDNKKFVTVKSIPSLDSDLEVKILLQEFGGNSKIITTMMGFSIRPGAEQVIWEPDASAFFLVARPTTVDTSGEHMDKLLDNQNIVLLYDLKSQKAYCRHKDFCSPIDSDTRKRYAHLQHEYASSLMKQSYP
jgi:hypothetical protein